MLEWIFQEHVQTGAFVVMETVAMQQQDANSRQVLARLHDRYPRERITFSCLLALSRKLDAAHITWLIVTYPERYAESSFHFGVDFGDLKLLERFAPWDCISKLDVKYALHEGIASGHLGMMQWFSHRFKDYLPTRVLWRTLRCGHLNVVKWVLKQKPELVTDKRLAEMYTVSRKQPHKNDPHAKRNLTQVTRWIETQQQQRRRHQLMRDLLRSSPLF